jgi:hypothetical protein
MDDCNQRTAKRKLSSFIMDKKFSDLWPEGVSRLILKVVQKNDPRATKPWMFGNFALFIVRIVFHSSDEDFDNIRLLIHQLRETYHPEHRFGCILSSLIHHVATEWYVKQPGRDVEKMAIKFAEFLLVQFGQDISHNQIVNGLHYAVATDNEKYVLLLLRHGYKLFEKSFIYFAPRMSILQMLEATGELQHCFIRQYGSPLSMNVYTRRSYEPFPLLKIARVSIYKNAKSVHKFAETLPRRLKEYLLLKDIGIVEA